MTLPDLSDSLQELATTTAVAQEAGTPWLTDFLKGLTEKVFSLHGIIADLNQELKPWHSLSLQSTWNKQQRDAYISELKKASLPSAHKVSHGIDSDFKRKYREFTEHREQTQWRNSHAEIFTR